MSNFMELLRCLISGIRPDKVIAGGYVHCSWLLRNFAHINLNVNPEYTVPVVRAFLLYLLGLRASASGFAQRVFPSEVN